MDSKFFETKHLAVYVNFKTSTILEGVKAGERNAFQIWVNLKILQAIHDKLVRLDLIGGAGERDPYFRVFGIESVDGTTLALDDKIHLLQKLAFSSQKVEVLQELGAEFLDRLLDTGFLAGVLKEVVAKFSLYRITLLFDEAAHTFIPSQSNARERRVLYEQSARSINLASRIKRYRPSHKVPEHFGISETLYLHFGGNHLSPRFSPRLLVESR